MKSHIRFVLTPLLTAALLCFGAVQEAFAGAGRQAALFLDYPHRSVRAAGLADTFVTVDNDPGSSLWNPAGLSAIQKTTVLIGYNSHSQAFGAAGEGLYYAVGALSTPLGNGVLNATLQLNGQGTIDYTTDSPDVLDVVNLGTNWVFSASYAEALSENLRAGLTGKIIRQVLGAGLEGGGHSSTSYALDAGVQWDLLNDRLTTAASILNYGTRVQFKDANQSDPLPRKFRAGASVLAINMPGEFEMRVSGEIAAAIDALSQNREAEDFVQTVDERMEDGANDANSKYAGRSRADIEDELIRQRGIGIHAFGWERLERSFGVEAVVAQILAVRAGLKWHDEGIEVGSQLDIMDRAAFGFGVNLEAATELPIVVDYANGLWGQGGPTRERIHSFSLSVGL